MVKKIVISYFNNIAAILQHNRIEEIIIVNQNYQVNDIYVGIVQKIFSSINAAFVKLGRYGKSGFIHISDIKPLKRKKYVNHINDVLTINQLILVQVVKEPTLNKGPRLTTNIHLHGKYLVLMPFCNIISISNKIYDENERLYLHSFAILVKPEMMGLLIKPSAQGVNERSILEDLDLLKKQWSFIEKSFIVTSNPCLVYKDEDLIKKVVRDFYDESIKKIIIDSEDGLRMLYYYLNKCKAISPIIDTKLQLYNKSECIIDQFRIKQVIKDSLKAKVKLLSGGYIIIENYEALTIIDVNSGSFNKSDNSKEAILKTNFYAAIEIAYQLKIRNINGIIIIDFIDMYSQRDQLQLLEHFNNLLKYDDAKPQIVQFSELGFVELTRRRRGQSLKEIFNDINIKNTTLEFTNQLNYNFCHSTYSNYQGKRLLANKYVRSLFFDKKFNKSILLTNKKFHLNNSLYSKYFIFLDRLNTVSFFNPKANYILPLILYLKLIN
uniref:Ribonuclease E n=1 Tax=Membranoptera platyphylla TaxID=1204437 RepID=A0A1I9KQE2_9FLOR|nr:ribonuclease E [Membranoptera platyphylla]AMJ16845.1 ribonuclease E [Membranoptera platyphylla]